MNNIQEALNYLNQLEEEMVTRSLSKLNESIEQISLDTEKEHIEISSEEKPDEENAVIEPLTSEEQVEAEDELSPEDDVDDDVSEIDFEGEINRDDDFDFSDLEDTEEEDELQEESLKEDLEIVDVEEVADELQPVEETEEEVVVEKEEPTTIKIEYDPEEVKIETEEVPEAEIKDETEEAHEEETHEEEHHEEESEDDVEEFEFDEKSFDGLYESYLKEKYNNVNAYRTVKVTSTNEGLQVEGKIRFTSGNIRPTTMTLREGRIGYICRNNQIGTRTRLLSEKLNNKIKFRSINEATFSLRGKRRNEDVDLTKKNSLVNRLMKDDGWKNETTVDGVIDYVKGLVNDYDTPGTRKLLYNLSSAKTPERAISIVYNTILSGTGNKVIR